MQTYRRRDSVQAFRWYPGKNLHLVEERKSDQPYVFDGRTWDSYGIVRDRNGLTVVHPGDWVVRSPDGELAVCRDDVFRQSYEQAETPPPGEDPQA